MNSKLVNGIYEKIGKVVIANINGEYGNWLSSTIPSDYRPSSEHVFAFVLVRSLETMRYFMGYLKFYNSGLVEGGVFADYGTNTSVTIFESKYLVYGTTSWITN